MSRIGFGEITAIIFIVVFILAAVWLKNRVHGPDNK